MSRRRRRRIRRAIRGGLLAALIVGLLPGLYLAGGPAGMGNPVAALFIVLATMVLTFVGLPILALVLVAGVAAVALPFAVTAAIFGGPLYLLYRLTDRRARDAFGNAVVDDEDETLTADALLRRRYVAGEITYDEFQSGIVALLKDRFARGAISLGQYEAELEKLIAPARHLDVKRDPAVAGAPRLN